MAFPIGCARGVRRGALALAPLALALGAAAGAARAETAERFVAVAWRDSQQGRGWVQRLQGESPWALVGEALLVGENPKLRFAEGRLYAISDANGAITAIDCDTWSVAQVYSLGAQSQPVDISVAGPDTAYVTTRSSMQLLRLDLSSGAAQPVLDIGGFEHPGGSLTAGTMARDAGRLFVQIARFDPLGAGAVSAVDPTGYLAVVDIATEQLVDVDPTLAGIQAIALHGTFPKYKMNLVRDARRLYLSASGAFFDEGGLEEVDVDALTSLGLVIAEADGNTGADLGSFAMVAADRGFLVSSTDLVESSHLARFSLAGGALPEELWVTVAYRVPTMVHDPRTHTLFVPDGGNANAVWVFDADTGELLNRDRIALAPTLGGPATDVELLCDPETECDCAVGYGCAAVPATSSLGLAALCLILLVTGAAIASNRFAAIRPSAG